MAKEEGKFTPAQILEVTECLSKFTYKFSLDTVKAWSAKSDKTLE